jgi:RHS repeat-associated protein/uncharacterized repeat protein (TIGR01451 family)
MCHIPVSRRQVKQLAVFIHRFISLLTILALCLPPMPAAAQTPETATPDPAATVAPTDTASSDAATVEPTATTVATGTPPLTETATATETPATAPTEIPPVDLATPAPAQAGEDASSPLQFYFTVSPEQATPGSDVTFTIVLVNSGKTSLTNVAFTNTLPEGLHGSKPGFGELSFDPPTRLLTWGAPELLPGATVTLQYTVTASADSKPPLYLSDTALLTAAELSDPLKAIATLLVETAGQPLSAVAPMGGQARGLDGKVQIELPPGAITTGGRHAILVKDMQAVHPAGEGQIWQAFEIQLLADPAVVNAAEAGLPATPEPDSNKDETDEHIALQEVEAKFEQPVELTISMNGLADLATLGAEYQPYLVTLDEASGVWVNVPVRLNREANTITAEVAHFSTWGAGIGSAFPTNGANILLFDSARPELFTGRSHFSIPIWTPPGRNGMTPSLSLSYTSGMADGVLGDIQAPWTGLGWSVDMVEISRKITNGVCDPCGTGSGTSGYGYRDEFILTFNGVGGELIPDQLTPGRYHTKDESFVYVQRHNDQLPPASPYNRTGEWWEVVGRDGTRWRLGYSDVQDTLGESRSEQLAAMKGYPGNNTGAWSSLGYAGHATDVVAMRWRAEQATDTHGNTIVFSYFEESRTVAGTTTTYDRASYLDTVTYTGHASGTPAAGYSVVFVRESRPNDVPAAATLKAWDNWDTYRLDRIDVKYGATVVRTYDLSYALQSYVIVLTSVVVSSTLNGGTTAPTATFTYTNYNNNSTGGIGYFPYPRLSQIDNGWEGRATFAYGNDGRTGASTWLNWRVTTMNTTDDKTGGQTMQTVFAYSTPCYNDKPVNGGGLGWCNPGNVGDLVGYGQTTVTTKNFAGGATLDITVHKFHTDEQKAGQEYEVQSQDATGTILSQANTEYTVLSNDLPAQTYFPYASARESKVRQNGALTFVNRSEYEYDPNTGNLTSQKEYNAPGPTSLFNDEFAAQNFNNWSSSVTNNGTLSVTSAAKLTGNYGMQAVTDNIYTESGGAVVMEAEKYTGLTAGTGNAASQTWQLVTTPTGFIGTGAMQALPNSGVSTGLNINGPALTYKINFQTTGAYYVYLRGYGATGNDDSVHVGLDGVPVTTGAGLGLTGFSSSGFTWRSQANGQPVVINVASPGVHTFEVWMREDGVVIDRIWLSTSATAVSNGSTSPGPAESASSGGATQYVQDNSPAGLTQYKAQFLFDPNSIVGATTSITILSGRDSDTGGTEVLSVFFKNTGGTTYQVRTRARDDTGNWVDGVYQTISDQAHTIGVYWAAATSAGANDGYVKLSIDGFVKDQVTGVDNDTRRVEMARWGVMTAPILGTQGTFYFDNFQSWGTIAVPYRTTEYDYAVNTSPSVWILDKVKRQTLQNGSGAVVSETRYGYDGTANGIGTKGELTLQQAVSGSQAINTAWVYDTWGNVIKTCAYTGYGTPGSLPSAACSGTSTSFRASTVTYDATLKTYAETATNPLGHTASTAYDFNLGVPTSVTDINGNMTATAYDGLGRVKTVTYPGYAQPGYNPPGYLGYNVQYIYPALVGGVVAAPFKVEMKMWDETANVYRSAWTFYDGLGRTLQVQGPAETGGQLILVDTKYDARGQTQYSGLPRFLTGTGGTYYAPTWTGVPHATNTYDALGRLTRTDFADATFTTTTYDGLKTTFRDQNAHQTTQVVDAFGRLVTVEEYTGNSTYTLYATTTYVYDTRNLLTQVTDSGTPANVTTVSYDGFGRKVQMIDPDMGDWRYRYDALGNLTAQIDNRLKAVNFYYDELNRLRGKTFNAGPVNASTYQPPADPGYAGYTIKYYFDAYDAVAGNYGRGHRTSMVDTLGTTTWTYNKLGQMTSEARQIGSATYKSCNTYDAFGRLLTQNYPSTSNCTGETLTHSYNASGALESVATSLGGNYITSTAYAASGQVNEQVLGNGVLSQSCYNVNNLRITAIRAYPGAVQSCTVVNPTNSKLNLKYTYFSNGNVQQIVDQTRSETSVYTYDDLDRLLSVNLTGGSTPYSHSFAYNTIGNLTSKAGVALSYTAQSGTCPDGALAKPHAATSAGSDAYCYDKNGNMVKRTESGTTYTQNFDTENRLTSVVTGGQTTTFVYNGDGILTKKVKPDGTYTLYLGVYEIDFSSGGAVTKKTSYYPGGAMRVDIVGGANTLYYMLKDHLGSASTLLDSTGNLVTNGEQRYYPFGENRIASFDLKTDHLFTGQLSVGLGGIYSYGARFYSPRLGRFLSADTIVPSWADPQSLNRYSYSINNPLRFTDPTGHSYCDSANAFAEDCGWTKENNKSNKANNYTSVPQSEIGRGCCITVVEPDSGQNCCITVVEPNSGQNCCITVVEPDSGQNCCITIAEPQVEGLGCCITIGVPDLGPHIIASTSGKPPTGKRPGFDDDTKEWFEDLYSGLPCPYCGRRTDDQQIDHIDPWKIIKQGAVDRQDEIDRYRNRDDLTNACPECNRRKQALLLWQFLQKKLAEDDDAG